MQRVSEDLKTGQFKQMYLFCGEEDYLRNQFKNRMKDALLGDGDKMNLSFYEGKDINQAQIIDVAETLPFLAERRVIVIEHSGLFNSAGSEILAGYLKECCETTYFVFNEEKVDKRNMLYKAVKSNGYVAEFGKQDEATLRKWITNLVRKENMQIESPAIALLLYKAGTEMENIQKELEKCICYCLNRGVITTKDVEEICTERLVNRIFDMVTFVATGKRERALKIYYDLLALKETPIGIMSMISRQFNMLLQTKSMREKGYNQALIADKLKVPNFVAGKYMEQAARFKKSTLIAALEDCVMAEADVKMGKISDVMSVELFIMKYGGKKIEKV